MTHGHIIPDHHMLNVHQVVFIISTLIPYLVIFTCYIQIVRTFKCSKRRLFQVSNFSNFNKADKVHIIFPKLNTCTIETT